MGAYLYFKLDDEIARYAHSYLADHYTDLEVKISGARYLHGDGIVISDVLIADPQQGGQAKPLLEIGELRLVGAFNAESLSTRRPRIDRIELHRPTLTATLLKSGRWSIESLFPLPEGDGPPVPLHIQDATVVVADQTKQGVEPITLRNISLAIEQVPGEEGIDRIEVEGKSVDSLARLVELKGHTATDGSQVDLELRVSQLGLSTQRLLAIPALPAVMLAGLSDIDGQLDANTTFRRSSVNSPLNWNCDFRLKRCTLSHMLLPKQLTGVEVTGQYDAQGMHNVQAKAKSGEAELIGMLNSVGWGPEARAAGWIEVKHLALGPDVYQALPDSMKGAWDRFDPRGEVDARANLWLLPGRVWSDVTVQGRRLSFEDTKRFPYRVSAGTGTIRYVDKAERQDSRLSLQIDAQAEGRPVSFQGEFRGLPSPASRKGEFPQGHLTVTANRMNVTKRLMDALPDDVEHALRKLRPEGEFGVHWTISRASPQQAKPTISMDMLVHDGAVLFDHFRYPVRGIQGSIQQRDKQWTFRDFISRGESGGAILTAAGTLDASGVSPQIALRINGAGAPLDESLRSALPPQEQQAWSTLRPSGRIDFESTIHYTVGTPRPQIDLTVRPSGESVSLTPEFFKYRLDKVQGEFVMRNNEVRFHKARARHGVTRFLADGLFQAGAKGGWRFQLTDMSIDRLNVGSDFHAAAPVCLRKVLNHLKPEGGVAVHHGELTFTRPADANQPLYSHWDLQIDCQQLDIEAGVRMDDLFGMIRIVGDGVGDSGVSKGELQLESMVWNGLQLTNITGPLFVDHNQCSLGRGASYLMNAPQRPITAAAYGGVASLDARAEFHTLPTYALDLVLESIDLTRLNKDYLHNSATLTGKLDGTVQLQGTGNSIAGLTGSGQLVAREADLYELPVLISMLNVLRNKPSNSAAFDRVEAQFTLRGEYLEFKKLDLLGSAISLYGRGSADFDRNVDLVFHTLMGRKSLIAPVRALVGQASEQLFKLKVTGPIDRVQVTREALPLVNNMIQQLQKDLTPQPLTRPAERPGAAANRR